MFTGLQEIIIYKTTKKKTLQQSIKDIILSETIIIFHTNMRRATHIGC